MTSVQIVQPVFRAEVRLIPGPGRAQAHPNRSNSAPLRSAKKTGFSGRGQAHFSGPLFSGWEREDWIETTTARNLVVRDHTIVLISVVNTINSDQTNYLNAYGLFHSIYCDCR